MEATIKQTISSRQAIACFSQGRQSKVKSIARFRARFAVPSRKTGYGCRIQKARIALQKAVLGCSGDVFANRNDDRVG
jgi:hypothetical protein